MTKNQYSPEYLVVKMLGHSDTKMTRHYAKVLDKSIMRDMERVNKKMYSNFK